MKTKIATLIALLLLSAVPTFADDSYTFVIKKQEEKAKSRWSLSEWLDQRDRMRMMDLWLALHSPSPFEFWFGGSYHFASTTPGGQYNPWDFHATAHASIFGLAGISESSSIDSRWLALFNLRIFGMFAQATNITLQAGIKNTNNGWVNYRNAVAGVDFTIYLAKYFGIEGVWRHSFTSVPNSAGIDFSGNRYEATAFIDYKFFRVFGTWYHEAEDLSGTGVASVFERTGVSAGARLYF